MADSLTQGCAFLALQSVKGVGRITGGKIARKLAQVGLQLADIQTDLGVRKAVGDYLSRAQLDQLLQKIRDTDHLMFQLREIGVGLTWIGAADYPSKILSTLANEAPLVITYVGRLGILDQSSVGFCGSRHVSEKGLRVAQDCADQMAKRGIVVVSGNATGVDRAAHFAALAGGGKTVLVIPEGIMRFRIRRDLEPVWDNSRVLVISEYAPNMPWNAQHAMERNKTIIALSDAMLVIEAGRNGGTMHAGITTLKLGKPLYVADYEGAPEEAEGNQLLLNMGGHPLRKGRQSGRASLDRLIDSVVAVGREHMIDRNRLVM